MAELANCIGYHDPEKGSVIRPTHRLGGARIRSNERIARKRSITDGGKDLVGWFVAMDLFNRTDRDTEAKAFDKVVKENMTTIKQYIKNQGKADPEPTPVSEG